MPPVILGDGPCLYGGVVMEVPLYRWMVYSGKAENKIDDNYLENQSCWFFKATFKILATFPK